MAAVTACVFFGCSESSAPRPAEEIKTDFQYYIAGVIQSSFTYPSNGKKVNLRTNDHSFIQFASGFKTAQIWFDNGSGLEGIELIITKCALKDNNINANIQRIYNGDIIRYSVTSDASYIYITALAEHTIRAVNDEGNYDTLKVKNNEEVLRYYRTEPGYIGGA